MDVQLFATTHSLEAVDGLLASAESDSDLVLYRLEPKESQTRVVRRDGHRLRRLREELGQEVRWGNVMYLLVLRETTTRLLYLRFYVVY